MRDDHVNTLATADIAPNRERVSALMDGELDDATAAALLRDPAAIEADQWATYHLIGDALRGTVGTGMTRAGWSVRLDAEPAILAPQARSPSAADSARESARESARFAQSRSSRRWRSIAAGAAAVAMVGWVALAALTDRGNPLIAVGTPAATSAAVGSVSTAPATAPTAAEVRRLPARPAAGVEDYLIAHQRFSSTSAMQGAVPYVRLVAEEGPEPRP